MKTESRMECPKARYKVRNWSQYNKGLVSRGSITLWIPEDCDLFWFHQGPARRGAQWVYSDAAIEVALVLRKVFRLPFRQAAGFLASLLALLGTNLPCPDYTLICRRQGMLKAVLGKVAAGGNVDLVLDSTGLKVYGEGEWKVKKHGAGKHRTWRKLHVAVDPATTEVHAVVLTGNNVHDCDAVGELLGQVGDGVKDVLGDGAYDVHKVYKALKERNIRPVIPPKSNARVSKAAASGGPPSERDLAVMGCAEQGRKEWKEGVGYHRRSKVETFMFRYKQAFGDRLQARKMANQAVEVAIACKILNKMIAVASPVSERIG